MTALTYRAKPAEIQAIQFNGLDDYLHIVQWLKDSGDTYALADEIRYTTPIMLLQTPTGAMAANPGDWIIRYGQGVVEIVKPDVFAATFEQVPAGHGDTTANYPDTPLFICACGLKFALAAHLDAHLDAHLAKQGDRDQATTA